MKDLTNSQNSSSQNKENNELSNNVQTKADNQGSEKQPIALNETLLSSLPYPAMYVRRKDRIVLAANAIALHFGAKIGEHCWRGFGKSEYISDTNNKVAVEYPSLVPDQFNVQ